MNDSAQRADAGAYNRFRHFCAVTLATPSKVNSNDWVEFSATQKCVVSEALGKFQAVSTAIVQKVVLKLEGAIMP